MAAQVGPIMNFNLFFICGVPGGIDYLMLALVKERIMLPLTEKKHNNTIQVRGSPSPSAPACCKRVLQTFDPVLASCLTSVLVV